MLRTKITVRDRVTGVADAEAAFPRGDSRFERPDAGAVVSEAAIRASEAVFFYAESRACYAIADWCGSGQEAGVASLLDVLAGRRHDVCPLVGGSSARRKTGCRAGQGHRARRLCGRRNLRY